MTTESQTLPVTTRSSGFRWRRLLLIVGLIAAVLVIGIAAATYAYTNANQGKILPGVSIGTVNVAGLTPDQAKAKLQNSLPDVSSGALEVKAGSVDQKISYEDLNRSYNIDSTIDQAMKVGRQGSPLDQLGDQLRTMTSGVTLTPSVTYDSQALQQHVAQIVATAQVTPVDATISFQNGDYVVTPASDGQQIDEAEVMRQAIAALDNQSTADTSISVPATAVTAGITTPDAQAARPTLRRSPPRRSCSPWDRRATPSTPQPSGAGCISISQRRVSGRS